MRRRIAYPILKADYFEMLKLYSFRYVFQLYYILKYSSHSVKKYTQIVLRHEERSEGGFQKSGVESLA